MGLAALTNEPLLIQKWWESDGNGYDWKLLKSTDAIAWIKTTTFMQFRKWEKRCLEVGVKHDYSNKILEGKIAERAREVSRFLNKVDAQTGLKSSRGDNDPRNSPVKLGHLDRDKFIAL